jgi:CheY-like chemotaxis protein
VYEAPNGVAALQFLATQLGQIDLVLTDIVMPGMTGQDLARSIRSQYPNLPILCMSGYTGDEMTARGDHGPRGSLHPEAVHARGARPRRAQGADARG